MVLFCVSERCSPYSDLLYKRAVKIVRKIDLSVSCKIVGYLNIFCSHFLEEQQSHIRQHKLAAFILFGANTGETGNPGRYNVNDDLSTSLAASPGDSRKECIRSWSLYKFTISAPNSCVINVHPHRKKLFSDAVSCMQCCNTV